MQPVDDPKATIDRALRADPEAMNALVAHLCPPIQRQINAAIVSRGLVPRLARQSVLDMTQTVLSAVFANQGASFQSWDPQIPLQTWAAYIADAHADAALNQICPPPPAAPTPASIEAWWQAVVSQDGAQLPVAPDQVEHALIMLRPMMQHEHQAFSASQLQFLLHMQAVSAPQPKSKTSDPARKSLFPLDAKQKRGVYLSAGMTVVLLAGMAADRITSDPAEDLVPSFALHSRQGSGAKPAVYAQGEPIEVRLRPAEPIDPWAIHQNGEPVILSVEALAKATEGEVVNWNYELTRSETGDFVLTGEVGKNLPVTPGEWELFVVVGPREDLDLLNSQAVIDVEPPPPPFERVRYKFIVSTSTVVP